MPSSISSITGGITPFQPESDFFFKLRRRSEYKLFTLRRGQNYDRRLKMHDDGTEADGAAGGFVLRLDDLLLPAIESLCHISRIDDQRSVFDDPRIINLTVICDNDDGVHAAE